MRDNIDYCTPGKKYKDIWGDVWIAISSTHLKRLKDRNIGYWDNGEGLTEL